MVVRKGTRSRAPVWDPLSGTNSAVARPLPCRDASLQAGNIRLQIVALGGDPRVIVVGAKVAVAWIARKGDNRALLPMSCHLFFFQAEDGIRDWSVTGVQTCALPI